jgi:hypothetical protein
MGQRQSWLTRGALLAVLAGWLVGCVQPSVYTTRNTTLPVMLGPVKNMRAPQPMPQGPVVGSFVQEVENFFFVASSSSRSGNVVTTVTTAGWQREGAAKFDVAMLRAAATCPQCTLKTQRVGVGAYYLFWLCAIMEKNWATAFATIHGPAR